jgi:sortase A
LIGSSSYGSRAVSALLLFLLLLSPACTAASGQPGDENASTPKTEETVNEAERTEEIRTTAEPAAKQDIAGTKEDPEEPEGGKAKEPEEPAERGETSGDANAFPEYRDFYSEGDPETPAELVSSESSSGAIPAVKPFNFGRDPGGPKDKTLSLTVPKLDLADVPVFDSVSEDRLRDGTVHVPATGYPWQKGANVFIAGHRIGYANTDSYYVFYHLDWLEKGDEISLEDSAGGRYLYRVTRRLVVGPDSVEVMNAVEGESLITLQTCTLPDYERRLIVQGELVEKRA